MSPFTAVNDIALLLTNDGELLTEGLYQPKAIVV